MAMSTEKSSNNDLMNELSQSTSPYLLQHAGNPVAWQMWSPKALASANQLDRPIFLSIGYSTCHWCHVMEKESFENDGIAKILNENFVPIKMDREEFPGPDKMYMNVQTALHGSGGWPLNLFLTPELKPFFSGTYFPLTSRYGQPGFGVLLNALAQAWKNDRGSLEENGNEIVQALSKVNQVKPTSLSLANPYRLVDELLDTYDEKWGGYGMAPKFPTPPLLYFLLNHYKVMQKLPNADLKGLGKETMPRLRRFEQLLAQKPESDEQFLEKLAESITMSKDQAKSALFTSVTTLLQISRGGIRDHVAGGFHRYSVDREWHVPHFEKMLYDQGQLLELYSLAYKYSEDLIGTEDENITVEEREELLEAARDIVKYVTRDLLDAKGGFYCAEDADSLPTHEAKEKKEGAFAVWTFDEVQQLMQEAWKDDPKIATEWFCKHFDIHPNGNAGGAGNKDPHGELRGKNCLRTLTPLHESAKRFGYDLEKLTKIVEVGKEALLQHRLHSRPKPGLDDKILASWNGLMIRGLAMANLHLGLDTLDLAVGACKFIKSEMYRDGKLIRVWRLGKLGQAGAVSDDYAFVIRGVLGLIQALEKANRQKEAEEWLKWAHELVKTMNDLFLDQTGGYYLVPPQDEVMEWDGIELPKCQGQGWTLLRFKDDQDGAEPTSNSVMAWNSLEMAKLSAHSDLYLKEAVETMNAFGTSLNKYPRVMPMLLSAFQEYEWVMKPSG